MVIRGRLRRRWGYVGAAGFTAVGLATHGGDTMEAVLGYCGDGAVRGPVSGSSGGRHGACGGGEAARTTASATSAGGGALLYDDVRRRQRLAKRLRDAGFDDNLKRASGAATATIPSGENAQVVGDGDAVEPTRRIRRFSRDDGDQGRARATMCDGAGYESTMAGYGGAGFLSGLPVRRSDG